MALLGEFVQQGLKQARRKLSLEEKKAVVDSYAETNPKAFARIKKRVGSKNVERQYAAVKHKQAQSKKFAADRKAEKPAKRVQLFQPDPEALLRLLNENGYKLVGVSPTGNNEIGRGLSEYYQHPETKKTVRVSDHRPVYQRSLSSVMVHPGSHDNIAQIEKQIKDSASISRGVVPAAAVGAGLLAAPEDSEAGLLGVRAMQQPSLADKGAGILDVAANAASGLVAPILSAPSVVTRYAADRLIPGVNFSAEEMAKARKDVEDIFDYQPRTELGQQYSDQALQGLGGLLAPVVEASEDSKILGLLGDAYDYIGPQRRELVNALLDMSPI